MITDAEWLQRFALLQRQTNDMAEVMLQVARNPAGMALGRERTVLLASLLLLNVKLLTGVLPLDDQVGIETVAKNTAALDDFGSLN